MESRTQQEQTQLVRSEVCIGLYNIDLQERKFNPSVPKTSGPDLSILVIHMILNFYETAYVLKH